MLGFESRSDGASPTAVSAGPTRWARALAVGVGAALMALGAQVSIPMVPVPMTLQSLAVVVAGGALGARWGVASVMLYLAVAALSLPVLSDGRGGLQALSGPTAGYLFGFVAAAAAAGVARGRGWLDAPLSGVAILGAAHLLILVPGAGWLASSMGWPQALTAGFTPFLIGAIAKSVAAWAILRLLASR